MVLVTDGKMSVLRGQEQKHSNDCKNTGRTLQSIHIASSDTVAKMVLKRWKTRRGLRKKKKKVKEDKRQLFFHVLQFWDTTYNDGWSDEEISRDWGVLYRLKKELEKDIPEFKFRIVTRSTYYTWSEVKNAFDSGVIDRNQFDLLAIAINTGTNLPSVATPNGQAAFLFLLTSSIAPLINLSYLRMIIMALPYTFVLTAVGLYSVI